MSEQLTLSLLTLAHSRRNDLPPFWDGVPVTWTDWSDDTRSTLILHLPAEALACDQCGSVDESRHAFGTRPPPEGATVTTTRTKKTKSGREYVVHENVPARPVRDLRASRCRHCGHDTIHDERTDQTWDLDETDYGPEGSAEDGVLFPC